MLDVTTLREAMDVVNSAEDHLLEYRSGVRVGRARSLRHIHYDTPLWWETDAFQSGGLEPEQVISTVHAAHPGPHLIGVVTHDPKGIIPAYAALGYKTVPSEPVETVMARSLRDFVPGEERWPVQRARTEAQRQLFNSDIAADDAHGQMRPEELHDPIIRRYFVELDGRCVCKGTVILPKPGGVTVEPLGTESGHRRRGIATALMNRLHAEAAEGGVERSVIVATAMGAALYGTL